MGFVHGKNSRVWIDGYDLSQYFTEADLAGKVEMADTTTFALTAGAPVAKTVIAGVTDGQIKLKGLWQGQAAATSTTSASLTTVGPDNYFDFLITLDTGSSTVQSPQNVDTCCTVGPTGALTVGSRVWCAAGIVTNYQIQSPVKNVTMIDADIQADGGVDTGTVLHNPGTVDAPNAVPCTFPATTSLSTATLTPASGAPNAKYPTSGQIAILNNAGAYVLIAYTGTSGTTFTGCTGGAGTSGASATPILQVFNQAGVNDTGVPAGSSTTVSFTGTIVLADGNNFTVTTNPITAGFPATGAILIPTSGGAVTVYYSGLSSTQFLNMSGTGGATTTSGGAVTLPPITNITGGFALLHAGGTGGIAYAALQSSDDNSTWTNVGLWNIGSSSYGQGEFGTGQYGGSGLAGGYILLVPQGVKIQRFVRVQVAYTSTTTGCPILVSFVRL